MKLSRRSFLKNATAASAGATLSGGLVQSVLGNTAAALAAGPGNKWPGRVVINFNKAAGTSTGTVDQAVLKKMVDDSIMRLTDKTTLAEAWKAVFPASLSATSKIAIKLPLGCCSQTVAPHWSLVKAITDGLQQMDFAGTKFPAANITLWDMHCSNNLAGYGFTAANFPNVKIIFDSLGTGYTDGAKKQQYATSLNSANFLINVFRAGGHQTIYEGFTLGFKNHYGTYAVDHGTATAPGFLRDINCTGAVYNKNVLSICAGIFGSAEASGSPGSAAISYSTYAKTIDSTITGASAPPTTLIMSTDPVTAEMQTVKMMRINNGGKYTTSDMPKYLRASGGVSGALTDATYTIGIIDESAMDIRRIINGSSATRINDRRLAQNNPGAGIAVSQISGHNLFIEFELPENHVSDNATIEISTMKGALVWKSSRKVMGLVNHFAWNRRDAANNLVRPGVYVVRVAAGATNLATKFSIAS